MIDFFIIFTKTGLVLFTHQITTAIKGDPVGDFIRAILIEGRSGDKLFTQGEYGVKWQLANEVGIVFAAVYHKFLQPVYLEQLLATAMKAFIDAHGSEIPLLNGKVDFERSFNSILAKLERTKSRKHRAANGSKASLMLQKKRAPNKKAHPKSDRSEFEDSGDQEQAEEEENSSCVDDEIAAKIEQARKRMAIRRDTGSLQRQEKDRKSGSDSNQSPKPSKEGKKKRVWGDKREKLSAVEEKSLDVFSKNSAAESDHEKSDLNMKRFKSFLPEVEGEKVEFEREDVEPAEKSQGWGSQLASFFDKVSGQKPLEREDLVDGIERIKSKLIEKNVASDVADDIVANVEENLLGKKLNSFTKGVKQAIKDGLRTSLQQILTPKKSTDVLRDISSFLSQQEVLPDSNKTPYTIVFLGVNGVGKSTTLSKVCYYLKSNGLKVLLCACDTFRSGAVEQLKVHARNLKVELFEAGYGKDPASVALSGKKYAKANGFDVVLIDTAGRMQNNVPLMREIAKLVSVNKPNLTLFIGEALVGNDGVNQLLEFNKFLMTGSNAAGIDGMILTKFDTIDDKVGAAVSLVHKCGQPIFFVGTGQKYTNLNKLNVDKVLKALLE